MLLLGPYHFCPLLSPSPAAMDLAEVWSRGATPCQMSGVVAKRRYHTSEVGAVAESAKLRRRRSGGEELPHVRGQGWRLGGTTPRPSSGGCAGTGGPRGATPHSRSGWVAVRRYPLSKVRSSSCALLEQP